MPAHVAGSGRFKSGRPPAGDGIVDEVAIERAAAGDHSVWLTVPERRATIAYLRRRGHSLSDIARRLGMSNRAICRHVAALRDNPELIGVS